MNNDGDINHLIKIVVFFGNDTSKGSLESIEKRLTENENEQLSKSVVVDLYHKQFRLLRKIECEYFHSSIQAWLNSLTNDKFSEIAMDRDDSGLLSIEPRTPFMLYCIQNIKKELDVSSYPTASNLIQSLQEKWRHLPKEMITNLISQYQSRHSTFLHSNNYLNDPCYQRFFSSEPRSLPLSYVQIGSISPVLSQELASLQSLVNTEEGKSYVTTVNGTLSNTTLPLFTPDGNQDFHEFDYAENQPPEGDEKHKLDEMRQLIMNKKSTEKRMKRVQKHKKTSRGKRSPTLYNLFFSHRMKEEKEKDSSISFVALSSKLSKEWNAMSEERKVVYCEELKRVTETKKIM